MAGIFGGKRKELENIVRRALSEDRAKYDITSKAFFAPGEKTSGVIIAKQSGVVCGLEVAALVFRTLDPAVKAKTYRITVRQNARVVARKADVPFVSPAFKVLSWAGIVSPAKEEARFYVDNLIMKE